MSIWYPSSGLTYSQYLQANSFVKDVSGEVRTVGVALRERISDDTMKLVANLEQLQNTYHSGFDALRGTLDWGFDRLEFALQNVTDSIHSLHYDFNYGMALLLEEIRTQSRLLSTLIDRLDAIHKTLQSPTLTQAREHYNIACERFSKGLLDKALESLLEAQSKNNADFFTQFLIGKLYLYGVDQDDNLLDLDKAKTHLLLAARYAKAELQVNSDFRRYAAEALLHASIAIYAKLGEHKIQSNLNQTKDYLLEARILATESFNLFPQLTDSVYHAAKYSALLGDSKTCIQSLRTAILLNRHYAVKVDLDHAFDSFRSEVHSLISSLCDSKRSECVSKEQEAISLLAQLSEWHTNESDTLASDFENLTQPLSAAKSQIQLGTYFALLDAVPSLDLAISSASVLLRKRKKELHERALHSISAAKESLPQSPQIPSEIRRLFEDTDLLVQKARTLLNQESYETLVEAASMAEKAKLDNQRSQLLLSQHQELTAR